MKKILFALALTVLATGSAMAQITLANDWKRTAAANTATPPDNIASNFFSTTDNLTRGFDVNVSANKVYVVSRTNGNLVRILNANTGADTGVTLVPPTGGYTGGTFLINKVGVADDNVIYVTNLALAAGVFNIYRHPDDTTAATAVHTVASADVRIGDDMAVKGSGNNTQIIVGGSAVSLSIFTTPDGGLTFNRTIVTPSNPAVSGIPSLAWDTTSGFWYRTSAGVGGLYTDAGVGGGQSAPRSTSSLYGPFDVATDFGTIATPVYALSSGNVTAGNTIIQGEIYAQSDLTTAVYVSDSVRPTGGTIGNGNAAGDVFIDSANDRVYWLVTNNVIARDSIAPADATDWNTYF